MSKKQKRRKRQRRHDFFIEVDPTDLLEYTDAQMLKAAMKLDKKRKVGHYIV